MTTRIALHLSGDLARRASRVLLDEPGVRIGLTEDEATPEGAESISSVAGWDALAVLSISEDSQPLVEEARSAGIPVVVGAGLPFGYPVGDGTFVVGAALGSGLAAALALSMLDPPSRPVETRLAWTVPGSQLGAGIPVTFPEPVGALWAGREESPLPWPGVTSLAAPDDSPWLAVVAKLKLLGPNAAEERIRGIADDAVFLKAVSISAAVLAAARDAYPPGVNSPGDPSGLYMSLARAAGLEIATFIPD